MTCDSQLISGAVRDGVPQSSGEAVELPILRVAESFA